MLANREQAGPRRRSEATEKGMRYDNHERAEPAKLVVHAKRFATRPAME